MPRDLTKYPDIPQDLVEHLKACFPPRCKRPTESLEEHMLYAGMAELTQKLAIEHERQNRAKYDLDEPQDGEVYED